MIVCERLRAGAGFNSASPGGGHKKGLLFFTLKSDCNFEEVTELEGWSDAPSLRSKHNLGPLPTTSA